MMRVNKQRVLHVYLLNETQKHMIQKTRFHLFRFLGITVGLGLIALSPAAWIHQAKADGIEVSVRVEKPGGSVCTECFVNVNPEGPGQGFGQETGDDGEASGEVGGPGKYRVEINYFGIENLTGPAPKSINIAGSGRIGTFKLVVPNLTGKIVEPDSDPVPQSFVNVRSKDFSFQTFASAGQDGTFKLGGVPAGELVMQVNAPQNSPFVGVEMKITVAANGVTNLGNVALVEPNVIGFVRRPDGTPLNAQCGEQQQQMMQTSVDLYTQDRAVNRNTQTRCDGSFGFGAIPAGAYKLRAQAPFGQNNFTPSVEKNVVVTAGQVANAGNLLLTNPQIVGTVKDPDGNPVQGASIDVHTQDWSKYANGFTGQDGKYSVGGLATGAYLLELRVPWGEAGEGLVAPSAVNVNVSSSSVLTKNLQFKNAVKFIKACVKRTNGSVVTDARVQANKQGGGSFGEAQVNDKGCGTIAASAGTWEVRPQPANFDGSADWTFLGAGATVTFKDNNIEETKTVNLEVATTNATVKGRALLPDGSPLSQGFVNLFSQDGKGSGIPIGPDGRFSLAIVSGFYGLSIFSDNPSLDFAERKLDVKKGMNDIGDIKASSKKARITGKVVNGDGDGIAGLRVNSFRFNGQGWGSVTSESDGTFEMPVSQGRWGVHVEQGGGGEDASPYVYDGPPLEVEIKTEDDTVDVGTIELTFTDATIQGNLVDQDGDPVGMCSFAFAVPESSESGKEGFRGGPNFGGPVDCQSGRFSIKVPSQSASTYILGIHTPPESDYASLGEQKVAVIANATVKKNIKVGKKDASVFGRLVDQNGERVGTCEPGEKGMFGDVFLESLGAGFNRAQIMPDCSYDVNVLGGNDYRVGFFIAPGNGFMESRPSPEPISVSEGERVKHNLMVTKADAMIKGKLVDTDGKGLRGFVFAGNWSELNQDNGDDAGMTGVEEGEGDDGKEGDAAGAAPDFENQLSAGTETDANGAFELGVVSGHIYDVNAGLPADSGLMPPKFERVDFTDGSKEAEVTLRMQKALGTLSGLVTREGRKLAHGFVHCWSEDGGFTGGDINNGVYAVNYVAGIWHCGADAFEGETYLRSEEVVVTVTDQEAIKQNFELSTSNFELPPSISKTFDASAAQVITLNNGTTINIPGGALSGDQENVTVVATPTVNVNHTRDTQPFGIGYELQAFDSDNTEISAFNSDVTITFLYTDAQLEELGVDEGSLVSKYYDESSGTWKLPNGVTQDQENNTISISTDHFTIFALVSSQGAVQTSTTPNVTSPASVPYQIVTGAGAGSGPQVHVFGSDSAKLSSFFAYDKRLRTGVNVAAGDLNGDGNTEIVTAPAGNGGPHIKVFDKNGNLLSSFMAFPAGFKGGVSVAVGDVNGDGRADIIVAPASNGGPQVKIFDANTRLLSTFMAYDPSWRMGLHLGTVDTEGDGKARILVSPAAGFAPQVKMFDENTNLVSTFFAFPSTLRCGAYPAGGDVNADGKQEIVVGAGEGCGPQVRIFDANAQLRGSFFAFSDRFRTGVHVAVGDLNNDGSTEIVAAPGMNGGPQVRVFSSSASELMNFFPYPQHLRTGVNIAAASVK